MDNAQFEDDAEEEVFLDVSLWLVLLQNEPADVAAAVNILVRVDVFEVIVVFVNLDKSVPSEAVVWSLTSLYTLDGRLEFVLIGGAVNVALIAVGGICGEDDIAAQRAANRACPSR